MATYIWNTEITNAYIGIPNPESITLDKSSISLTTVWQTEQLTATLTPTQCDQRIIWTTTNHTVATVSTTGLVTCVNPWNCVITAITANGLTASCGVKAWLPSTYQEVEYIESSGTQWIDTWVTATQNTISQIKVMNTTVTGDCIYWFAGNDDDADYRIFNYQRKIYWDFETSRLIWGSNSFTTNTVYEFEIWNNYVKNVWASTNLVTWTAISSYTSAGTITLNHHSGSLNNSNNRWYYVKIWNWATQVRDLVPCYRIADGVIWMYDLVNWVFYTNAGSGTFTKWSDVN